MKKLCAMLAIAGTMLFSPAFAADAPDASSSAVSQACEKFYNTTTAQAQDIIHNAKLDTKQKQQELAKLFDKTVETDWIGKFVIGRFWNAATDDQKKEYLKVYNAYLTQVYISKFDDEDLSGVELKLAGMSKQRSGDVATKTLIKRPGQPDVHVDYTLSEAGNQCHVHDIIIENVSLLSSQRSEFQSLAGQSGIGGVIEALKKKIS